jgi:hypothetical protein
MTMGDSSLAFFAAGLVAVGLPAAATAAEKAEDATITVTAQRLSGAVVGTIAPQVSLDATDIQALGASTVAEMIGLLSTQTRSGQGRGGEAPVILLAGRRISSFAEVRDLPPEAVARVDILPEEVALKYGYAATQRVLNIVLVDRFNAITGELEPRFATGVKRNDMNTEFSLVQIDKAGRFTLDLQYQTAEALTETRGGIIGGGVQSPFRTLLPKTKQFSANAVLARTLADAVSATVNGRIDTYDSEAGIGFDGAALTQRVRALTSHVGLTLGGDVAHWRWAMTSGYDRVERRTLTDTSLPTIDRATSTATTGALDFTANGTLLRLPAGAVSATFGGGAQTIRLDSAVIQSGGATAGRVARDVATGRVNVDVPLASRAGGTIGDLSINANFLAQRLSDFGTLTTIGVGARWSPVKPMSLLVSMADEDGPPTPQQLGNPAIRTPNIQVFDFSRGESATVTRIDGGTPGLTGDTRRIIKAELSLKPLPKADFALTATYVSSRIRNPIAAFPAVTPQVEAAFPRRIGRDAAGRLVSVDARPVNFALAERSEVRWGLSYGRSLGTDRTPRNPAHAGRWDVRRGAFVRRDWQPHAGLAVPYRPPDRPADATARSCAARPASGRCGWCTRWTAAPRTRTVG